MIRLAVRNLRRHLLRSSLAAGAVAIGVAFCMPMSALMDGMFQQMFDVMVADKVGHVQVHHPDYPGKGLLYDTVDDLDDLVAGAEALPDVVTVSPRLFGFGLAGSSKTSVGTRFVGIVPEREDALGSVADKVVEGAWLTEPGTMETVIGVDVASKLELGVGDELVLIGQAADGSMASALLHIVGIVRTGNLAIDRGGAYVHLSELQDTMALPDQAHEVAIAATDRDDSAAVADGVRALPAAQDLLVQTWSEADPTTATMMGMQTGYTILFVGIFFAVASLGVLSVMLMGVMERVREFGLLKALGLTPRQIVTMVLVEAAVIGVFACAVGLALGGVFDGYLVTQGIDFSVKDGEGMTQMGVQFDPVIRGVVNAEPIGIILAAVFLTTSIAAFFPALYAAFLRPVNALRRIG